MVMPQSPTSHPNNVCDAPQRQRAEIMQQCTQTFLTGASILRAHCSDTVPEAPAKPRDKIRQSSESDNKTRPQAVVATPHAPPAA